ncbi:MAG: metal-dependent hydrolase [Candidatus Binatia bacterium]
MPSPVGHALGGALVATLAARSRPSSSLDWRVAWRAWWTQPLVVAGALAGCLPDIDLLWGRHNMETHSVGAAVLAACVAWIATRQPRLALVVAGAWLTHVLFDWLGSDDTPPLGVMALWPFTDRFFFADAFVFEAISRRYWLPGFVAHNLWAVVTEVLMLGPLVVLATWRRTRRLRTGTGNSSSAPASG